jgi:hypothetical protein
MRRRRRRWTLPQSPRAKPGNEAIATVDVHLFDPLSTSVSTTSITGQPVTSTE